MHASTDSWDPNNASCRAGTGRVAWFALLLAAGCGDPSSGEDDTPDPGASREVVHEVARPFDKSVFGHPLVGLERNATGFVPLADVQDTPEGKRYGVEVGISVSETGERAEFAGVTALPVRKLSDDELAEIRFRKELEAGRPLERALRAAPKIGEVLAARIGTQDSRQTLAVSLRLAEPNTPNLITIMTGAMARGEVRSKEEYYAYSEKVKSSRRVAITAAQAPVVEAIEALGGTVTSRCKNMYCLDAELPAAAVEAVAQRADVVRLDLVTPVTPDVVTGGNILNGSQIAQYVDAGFDGENGGGADIRVAIVEAGAGPDDEHVGFRDGTGTSTRITARHICGASCTNTTNFTTESNHATGVSGIILGDLRDGQDSTVTSSAERIARSGYAGEAWGRFYQITNERTTYDHIVALTSSAPHVVNQSAGNVPDDPSCRGESNISRDANDLYEDGVLLIKSAGNQGNSSSTDCTVTSPGSAIGVFTVGAHHTGSSGETNVRNDAVASYSSRGGASAAEGKNRTIIDLTAFGLRSNMFDTSGGYGYSSSGTSFAAPTVTAAAIDFIDWNETALIGNPGLLHVNLLMMGDRASTGADMTSRFNNLYGAGRLKARKPDSPGMDFPWAWYTGSVCVGNGETVAVTVNGGAAIPSAVDVFKAAIWWYDQRHEVGTTIDDIDLYLRQTNNTLIRASESSTDEKERVFATNTAGKAVRLDITGSSVTADNAGCGTNMMRVYWSYFAEDSARDDADGPGTAIEVE